MKQGNIDFQKETLGRNYQLGVSVSVVTVRFLMSFAMIAVLGCSVADIESKNRPYKEVWGGEFIALEHHGSTVSLLIHFDQATESISSYTIDIERDGKLSNLETELMVGLNLLPDELVEHFGNNLRILRPGESSNLGFTAELLSKGFYGCSETVELSKGHDAKYCLSGQIIKVKGRPEFKGHLELKVTNIIEALSDEGRLESQYVDKKVSLKINARLENGFYTQYLGLWQGVAEWYVGKGITLFEAEGFGSFDWFIGPDSQFWIQPSRSKIQYNEESFFLKVPMIILNKDRFNSNDAPEIEFYYYNTRGHVICVRGELKRDSWAGGIFLLPGPGGIATQEIEIGNFLYLKN